jgi:hypothetical protein
MESQRKEPSMTNRLLSMTAAAALLIGTTALGYAQSSGQRMQEPGASGYAPGQKMQDKGSKGDQPGASGYAPGQRMQDQDKGSRAGPGQPGASGYAPGQQKPATTGSGTPDRGR